MSSTNSLLQESIQNLDISTDNDLPGILPTIFTPTSSDGDLPDIPETNFTPKSSDGDQSSDSERSLSDIPSEYKTQTQHNPIPDSTIPVAIRDLKVSNSIPIQYKLMYGDGIKPGDVLVVSDHKYTIGKNIGSGASGYAFDAILELPDKTINVVIKVTKDLEHIENFQTEAKIFKYISKDRKCNKYFACYVHEFVFNDQYAIVMEKISGKSLYNLMTETAQVRKIDHIVAIAIIHHLLRGFETLRKYNIHHRDIKPENIIITDKYMPVFIDFGLSCSVPVVHCSAANKDSPFIGTPLYVNPLQTLPNINKSNKNNLQHFDFYSICVVIYELINFRHPIESGKDLDHPVLIYQLYSYFNGLGNRGLFRHIPSPDPLYEEINEVIFPYISRTKQSINDPHLDSIPIIINKLYMIYKPVLVRMNQTTQQ